MNKKIVKTEDAAWKFACGGKTDEQRIAFFRLGGHAYRVERLAGKTVAEISSADGCWYDAKTTVLQALKLA